MSCRSRGGGGQGGLNTCRSEKRGGKKGRQGWGSASLDTRRGLCNGSWGKREQEILRGKQTQTSRKRRQAEGMARSEVVRSKLRRPITAATRRKDARSFGGLSKRGKVGRGATEKTATNARACPGSFGRKRDARAHGSPMRKKGGANLGLHFGGAENNQGRNIVGFRYERGQGKVQRTGKGLGSENKGRGGGKTHIKLNSSRER